MGGMIGGVISGAYKVGTGMAGVMGGSPERAAADEAYQSKMNAANIGELEAKQSGASEAGKLRALGSQMIAKQQTAYTASGVDTSQGTPLSVMADTRLMAERDAVMVENNAARKVRGYKEQRRQAGVEWTNAKAQDQQNQIGSMLSGIGDLTGAAASYSPGGK